MYEAGCQGPSLRTLQPTYSILCIVLLTLLPQRLKRQNRIKSSKSTAVTLVLSSLSSFDRPYIILCHWFYCFWATTCHWLNRQKGELPTSKLYSSWFFCMYFLWGIIIGHNNLALGFHFKCVIFYIFVSLVNSISMSIHIIRGDNLYSKLA